MGSPKLDRGLSHQFFRTLPILEEPCLRGAKADTLLDWNRLPLLDAKPITRHYRLLFGYQVEQVVIAFSSEEGVRVSGRVFGPITP